MRLRVKVPADIIASPGEFAQAAGRGVSNAVKRHLADRDRRGGRGLVRTGYYGDAANSVTTDAAGKLAVVTIHKEGMALHYYGGVVYPTDAKALAIPQVAAAVGKRPKEYDPGKSRLALVWPKGETTGTLRDKKTDEVVYLLVSKATIKADSTVLPDESALADAAADAMAAIIN